MLGIFSVITSAKAQGWEPKKGITIVSVDVGSAKYHATVALMSTVMKDTGVKIRVRPESKATGRMTLLRQGAVALNMTSVLGQYEAYGIASFNKDGWGPQPVRAVWIVSPLTYGYCVRKDSGIKTWADLEGKRVPDFGKYAALVTYMRLGLESFGRGLHFKKVPVSGYKEGCQALIDGALDMTYMTPLSPGALQLEAGRHGIRWLATPHADKKNWAIIHKIAPYIVPVVGMEGAGMSKEHPVETWGQNDRFMCYNWQDEKLVYWITKQIDKAIPKSKDLHPSIKDWGRKYADETSVAQSGFHPGAIKYSKEIGLWGPKEDQWQKEELSQEKERIRAWKAKHPGWKYMDKG